MDGEQISISKWPIFGVPIAVSQQQQKTSYLVSCLQHKRKAKSRLKSCLTNDTDRVAVDLLSIIFNNLPTVTAS
jgi:hypothetical protein